jgi:hypothetical protein
MFPFMANEMAFKNSVVLGTSANSVIPKNFSSMLEPTKIESTVLTRISAITAYASVADSRMAELFARLQFGASCPPPACSAS